MFSVIFGIRYNRSNTIEIMLIITSKEKYHPEASLIVKHVPVLFHISKLHSAQTHPGAVVKNCRFCSLVMSVFVHIDLSGF